MNLCSAYSKNVQCTQYISLSVFRKTVCLQLMFESVENLRLGC